MFLRTYATLLLSLLVVAGVCWLTLSWARLVDEKRFWEAQFGPAWVNLLAPQGQLRSYQSSLFSVTSVPLERLSGFERYRLQHGNSIVGVDDDYVAALIPLVSSPQSGSVLSVRMKTPLASDIWQSFVSVVPGLLPVATTADAIQQQRQQLQQLTGSEVSVLEVAGQPQFRFSPVAYQAPDHTVRWLVNLVFGLLLLALVVYHLIARLEGGLRQLEQMTQRLAQGHLSARAAIDETNSVASLADSFNRMADHIQRLIGIQREMLRAVSHELRTPVARLRFGVQIMEDEAETPYQKKQLKGMDSDLHELDQLIDEILTYARLEEGGPLLEFQRIDIEDVARQVVEETRLTARVEVIYKPADEADNAWGEAEPRYLHRAIQNLVGNACRYASSQVRVSCVFTDNSCRVDVEDDGPGIPEDQWSKVFVPFARLDDSRTRSSGGYGLGLSIVRRITYWHSGRAMVGRSDDLGGARFSLVWPRFHQDS